MKKDWIVKWWNSYKYRFVPWIAINVRPKEESFNPKITSSSTSATSIPIHHVLKSEEKLISDAHLIFLLSSYFSKLRYLENERNFNLNQLKSLHEYNKNVTKEEFGFIVERRKSEVNPDAGTGVFVTEGVARTGSVVALYCGTLYQPYEPLFFPSLGNKYIFKCSDGIHIDGNDKWISKSIYKSCAARDKFDTAFGFSPCCDTSWITPFPMNPLNVGQYVNNRSISKANNVVYQECIISPDDLTIEHFRYVPNVWSNPENRRRGIKVVPLVAVKDIEKGTELLSSYFTVLHAEQE